ncbi:heme oxygenase [Pseudomonas duriflava]|uniref:Heme oxygenase n=1 Tax=Pseudomonas duriflava TaxID=459528 RepID=A0A562QAS6_9PSED|nr:biliverdin-producing heme oxygenase [Pseudomonas duriflava]TWI53861.1 heme oxygenase [Pseudomonas duriflava]
MNHKALSFRERLRQAGSELHQQVDDVFSSYRLTEREGYQAFLVAHASALFPLEEMLERAGIQQLVPDWTERCRRFALAEDLASLGVELPSYEPLDLYPGEAAQWGFAYVLEGSRLGGKMLARIVSTSPDSRVREALRYLTHVPRGGHNSWPAFLQELECQAAKWPDQDVFEGQAQAFAVFLKAGQRFRPLDSSVI